ncbi:MAG: DeoR/GlpR family DNA-binding transcription regulator [Spirochaetales bacterium]|nr:DeoR/GlpR family DNA-binding transcription regulator [Spirochaetales bacterium]
MDSALTERERKILSILTDNTNTSVASIAEAIQVSKVTLRSDLSSLEEKGFIVRTHGGALPVFHNNIIESSRKNQDEKVRIAKAAAKYINDGDTIMIEAGTTTALIAKYLLGKRDLHVVTNSTLIIPYARINPQIHLTVVGGEFRPTTESLVGPITLRELEEFRVKKAFLGTDGFTLERGTSAHLSEGAEVNKRMAMQAEERFLVADSSKYGQSGFARSLNLEQYSRIITDSNMEDNVVSMLEEAGLKIERV